MSPAQVNGYTSLAVEQRAQAEAAFYDQWLQLQDDVLADKHPRFKLPASVKERLKPVAVSTPSSTLNSSTSRLPGLSNGNGMSSSTYASTPAQTVGTAGQANTRAYAQNALSSTGVTSSKSGIDPVLLTKSADLIRAEIQLKRQRIERQIKEAVDQRKNSSRYRDNEEIAPLATLTETLHKALQIVKPVSGLVSPANLENAASDSFDENSYYSSQVNDWSSEEGSPKKRSTAQALVNSGLPKAAVPASNSASVLKKVPEVERLDKQPYTPLQSFDQNESEAVYDAEREDSEEYSPPAADAFSGPDGDADAMEIDDDSSEFVPQDAQIPSPLVSVKNHVTHIAAPQPARISPLAVAKPSKLDQPKRQPVAYEAPASPRVQLPAVSYHQQFVSDDSTTSPRGSAQTSPAGMSRRQKTKNKKRKREAEATGKPRKTRNKAAASPEPYIKPEPVSPPPFAGPSSLQSARIRPQQLHPDRPQQLHPDVEIIPPPRQAFYADHPPPSLVHYGSENAASPLTARAASPAFYARPRRDDQDLRRVASLHAAQRPASPIAQYSPVSYRTMSQSYPERGFRYGEEQNTRAPQTQYIRSGRSASPPQVRTIRDAHFQTMPPPPPPPATNRIVVDQYGNRYHANDPSELQPRMSVVPQLRPELEAGYERAPSRQSVVYASRPAQSVYEDDSGLRMMPPPPPPPPQMRRVAEQQPEARPGEYPMYRQREYSRAPEPHYYREEAMYVREAPISRASVYPPEATPVGPYAPRAYSVRPEVEPVRYMSRQPSMAPPSEYVRMAEPTGRGPPPPAPTRAVSVMPGPEYGHAAEVRYGQGGQYATPGPRYAHEHTAGPRQVYVDQYGREIRNVGY